MESALRSNPSLPLEINLDLSAKCEHRRPEADAVRAQRLGCEHELAGVNIFGQMDCVTIWICHLN